jgi:hypothetical protein
MKDCRWSNVCSIYGCCDTTGRAVSVGSGWGARVVRRGGRAADLVEQPTWSIPESELPDLILSAHAAAAAVQELGCRLVAEADGRNLAEADGASSTTAWVDRLLGCGRFEASQVTLTARRLAGRYELVR